MNASLAPAAWPAALFCAGVASLPLLAARPSVGLAISGLALGACLRSRWSLSFAALCLGWIVGLTGPHSAPDPLAGLDRERIVDIHGVVAGFWSGESEGGEGPRATLEPVTVVQGSRVWLTAPPIALQLAAGIDPPAPGSRIRVRGQLRRAAGFANERPAPPGRLRLRVKSAQFLRLEQGPSRFSRLALTSRRLLERPFDRHSGDHAGVAYARGLLFGELGAIPERDQRAFRRAGLAHLLAVSGMNVALAVAFVAALGSFLGRRVRLILFGLAILFHLLAVGSAPSLLRASAMAVLALAALALRRPPLPLQTLSLSAAALVLVSPRLLADIGFQLSCAATFGIVTIAPWIALRLPVPVRFLRLGLAASIGAQLATVPISAAQFSSVSPGALLLNLVFVPLASFLLVGAFAWASLTLAVPALGALAAAPLDLLAMPFRGLALLPAGPWLSLPTTGTALAGLFPALATGAVLLLLVSRRRSVLLAGLLLVSGSARPLPRGFELVVPDVGQGEGVLVRSGGVTILVDGGGVRGRDLAAQVWLPLLARRGVGSLEAMLVTHGDLDHCGGLVDVAVHIPVEEVWAPAVLAESRCVRELLFWTRATWRGLAAGDRLKVGPAELELLAPEADERVSSANAVSLVARLVAGGRRVLLTGDLDGAAEARLVARAGAELACDVLKVGHHGSARGTGAPLLAAARPRLALVSAGVDNRFGHPAPAVLRRLEGQKVRTFRTDRQGEIALAWTTGGPLRIALPGSPRVDG